MFRQTSCEAESHNLAEQVSAFHAQRFPVHTPRGQRICGIETGGLDEPKVDVIGTPTQFIDAAAVCAELAAARFKATFRTRKIHNTT